MPDDVALRVAPGMRIELRSVEWLVKRTQTTGMRFTSSTRWASRTSSATGRCPSSSNTSARAPSRSWTRPTWPLVPDRSPHYKPNPPVHREPAPVGGPVPVGGVGGYAGRHRPHAVPTGNRHARPCRPTRPRILIADDVGLGKTIEAGILVSELIARGRGKRILVVTTKAMLTQFQKEFWIRFSIALTRLDSDVLANASSNASRTGTTPSTTSTGSSSPLIRLKNNKRFGTAIENATWDIIVIDEAQKRCPNGDTARAGVNDPGWPSS